MCCSGTCAGREDFQCAVAVRVLDGRTSRGNIEGIVKTLKFVQAA